MSMGEEYRYPVEVEGDWASINPKTLQSKVQIYFQSKKKSQGGDCVIKWTERSATVCFKSELIRDDVLSKNDHEVTIDSQTVKLKLKPSCNAKGHKEERSKPTGTIKPELQQSAVGPDESSNRTSEAASKSQVSAVALKNLPDRFDKEFLLLLVGNVCDLSEDEFTLEFIPELSTAVVTFKNPNIAEKFLIESRKKRKFQQYGLTTQALEESRIVKVENLPDQCNRDLLELYFEKWGGEVKRITMIPDEQAAIVTFEKQDAAEKILGKQHQFHNTPVSVYPYFDALGTALYGKDRPTFILPLPFTENIHPSIREFLHKKGKVQFICNRMDSHFCQVNMDKDEVLLSPLPALLRQKGITKKQIGDWKQHTTDVFKSILSNFAVFEYSVTPSLWTEVEKDIRSTVNDKAVLDMNASTGCLVLAGMAQDIEILRPILEDLLKKVSMQLERESSKTSESINTTPGIFYLLQQEGLEKDASAKYPHLELTYKKHTSQVTLEGLTAEIAHVKSWILERKYNMKHKTLKMDPSLVEFLRSADWQDMSGELFISKNIMAVCRFENGDMVLTGTNDKALTEAEQELEMMLTFKNLSLEDVGVLEKREWQELCDAYSTSRRKTVLIKSSINRDKVIVCGFREPVLEISKHLENFITTHSSIDKTIRVKSYAVVKFIKEKKTQVLQKLLDVNEVKIHFDPKRPLIRVSGERSHVQPALEFFQTMADTLHTDKMTIEKAGTKKYFQEQGPMVMAVIKDHRFVVVLEDGSMKDEGEDDFDSESREKKFGQPSCEVQTPSGITIAVRIADMCRLKVDAVVNAANEDLQHIGGLALALLKAAGQSLQECSDRFIDVNGKLNPGQAITTEAGRLPCKYVVHTVGPRYYNHDEFTSVKILRQAVRESLNQAALNNCTSIAVPAISSGIFGFPLDLCAETIAKELRDYTQSHQGGMNRLREIHLVDNNPKTVNAMAQAVKKEFADFSLQTSIPQQMGSHGHDNHGGFYSGESYDGRGNYGDRGRGPESDDPQVYRMTYDETPSKRPTPYPRSRTQHEGLHRSKFLEALSTQEGLKIILREGNIQDAFSDVIVNTVSENLDLSQGAVSKALLQAAGPQMQTEAYSNSSQLRSGVMVVTDGYNLNCQRVFHVVCPFWNRGAGSEVELLKRIIHECLKKAENWKLASISFPAIGTGNLGFPKDLVSKILLSEVHAFSARVCPQNLNEVTVIVHPSDSQTVQCFIKGFQGGGHGPITRGAHADQQWPAKKVPPASFSQSSGLLGMVSTPTLGVHQMQIGSLSLEVSSGDITKERCDAIVNSSNSTFNLKTGVSKAILDAAGSSVEQECAQIAASQSGQREIITTAGQLPSKNIIHIIGRNNPADIKDIVYSVLKLCEKNSISSVVFPALGTGQGGASPSAVADAMIDAVINFVKNNKGGNVQTVKFMIFQTSMVSDFHKSMLKRQQEGVGDQSNGVVGFVKGLGKKLGILSDSTESSAKEGFVIVREKIEPVVFQLCGETKQDLREARELINSMIVKEYMSSSIQDSSINYLNAEQSAMLHDLQRELAVCIYLSKQGPEPEITLEGLTRDVLKAEGRIRDVLRKMDKEKARQLEAFKLGSQIEWQYQNRKGNFVACDVLANYDLENAFMTKQRHVMITINNEQYDADIFLEVAAQKNKKIKLKRAELKDQSSEPLPSHWDDMKGNIVLRVPLQTSSSEYADVEKEFRKTGLGSNIIEIERVQNDTLWKNYMNEKVLLDKKNNHTNNERRLFHGTSSANIDKINIRGFDRSFAGTHGAMCGNGVYFAVDPCYSAKGYAKPDQKGHKRMYWARVLVGDFTTGKPGLLSPPDKSLKANNQYDSVTDYQQNPTMFVIFHDLHAYPEYLITFN